MKLYNSVGPNPQVVRSFIAEKGGKIDMVDVDIMAGENRQEAHMKRNPVGSTPALELDDGSFITEITAICEYLDEVMDGPSLIGDTPEARAATRMWTRRIDLYIVEPMANGFRYSEGLPLFQPRITVIPEAADGLKKLVQEKLAWLDGLMGKSEFIAGDSITMADVLLHCFLTFGASVGQPFDQNLANLKAWYDNMADRPSLKA